MPFRVIVSVLFLGLATAFIAFNQGNACDVSFGFKVLPQVPVYLTILASLAVGMLLVIPFAAFPRGKRRTGPSLLEKAGEIRKRQDGAGNHEAD